MGEGGRRDGVAVVAKCVLTVDLSAPERIAAPPLVLDEEQQRRISRVAGDMAEGAREEISSRFGALARDLLRERMQTMVREGRRAEALDGLRSVFGEARAEVIAAAFMPNDTKQPRMPGQQTQKGDGTKDGRGGLPRQPELF